MKRQRRILKWLMRKSQSTARHSPEHRIRVERLEDRNCMASDIVEESIGIDHDWIEDAPIEASDTYVDVNQTVDESSEPVFDKGIEDFDYDKGNNEFIVEQVEPSEDIEDALSDKGSPDDTSPFVEPTDEVVNTDDIAVEWIVDQTAGAGTETENSVCPIDPDTGYETFCQDSAKPSRDRPDRLVDLPNGTETEKKEKEPEFTREFIPTINPGRRERIGASPAPIVELSRPQLFGLRQLTIDSSLTIDRSESLNINATNGNAVSVTEIASVIETGGNVPKLNKPDVEDLKSSSVVEKPSEKILDESKALRFHQSKWRPSIESLRPLISQIPWLSPLLKRSTSERDKAKIEDDLEPETVGIQSRDFHRSPSDKPITGEKEEKHTKSSPSIEQSPVTNRTTKPLDLPSQEIRNGEGDIDSKVASHSDEDLSPSNRHLALFLPSLIGLAYGRNLWWLGKKNRNKTIGDRPLPIESEADE